MERYGIIHGPGRPSICIGLAQDDWVTICTLASDHSEDIVGQAQQIFAAFDGYLADTGSDKSRLLTAQVWLKNMRDYEAFNDVWNDWIDRENPPTRSCVSANMASPRALIEIRITAARKME